MLGRPGSGRGRTRHARAATAGGARRHRPPQRHAVDRARRPAVRRSLHRRDGGGVAAPPARGRDAELLELRPHRRQRRRVQLGALVAPLHRRARRVGHLRRGGPRRAPHDVVHERRRPLRRFEVRHALVPLRRRSAAAVQGRRRRALPRRSRRAVREAADPGRQDVDRRSRVVGRDAVPRAARRQRPAHARVLRDALRDVPVRLGRGELGPGGQRHRPRRPLRRQGTLEPDARRCPPRRHEDRQRGGRRAPLRAQHDPLRRRSARGAHPCLVRRRDRPPDRRAALGLLRLRSRARDRHVDRVDDEGPRVGVASPDAVLEEGALRDPGPRGEAEAARRAPGLRAERSGTPLRPRAARNVHVDRERLRLPRRTGRGEDRGHGPHRAAGVTHREQALVGRRPAHPRRRQARALDPRHRPRGRSPRRLEQRVPLDPLFARDAGLPARRRHRRAAPRVR